MSFAVASRVALRRLSIKPERGCLSVCFDDVPRTAWTNGGRILGDHNVRGTFYLCGDLCGTTFEGREQYRKDDVRDMVGAGHEIGSHLFHHESALSLQPGRLRESIELNDDFFRDTLGPEFRARSFAYPYGEISISAKWLCSRRFESSRSVMPGLNRDGTDCDQLKILPLDNVFFETLDWAETISNAAKDRAWVIGLAHGVDDTGHDFSCPPHRLGRLIAQARDAGLEILPVGDVVDRIRPVAGEASRP